LDDKELQELGAIYDELAGEFDRASERFRTAVRELVEDTFPHDPPIVEYQSRQKELASIAKKAAARGLDPDMVTAEMTDLIGARLICLHLDQIPELKAVLRVLEQRSVINIKNIAEWIDDAQPGGYRGVHVDGTINISKQRKGGVETKEVPCEIQIRTLTQHAWAVRAHGLIHKPDIEPSDSIKKLFEIESLRLHGHQNTMDVLRRMALDETRDRSEESLNPLSLKKLAEDYGYDMTDDSAVAVYGAVRSKETDQTVNDIRQILDDNDTQSAVKSILTSQLGRDPGIAEQLLLGGQIRSDAEEGRFLAELDVIASPEFRTQEIIAFDFSVIGRVNHDFSTLHERAGGWITYHSRDHNGRITGISTDAGDPDGVELSAPGAKGVFRAAYPAFLLEYPGHSIVADFDVEGRSHFFVLLSTQEGRHVFLEFGAEYEQVAVRKGDRGRSSYVTSPISASQVEPTVRCNIDDLLDSAGLSAKVGAVQGLYCQAAPRMVLRRVEVHQGHLRNAQDG
jgi:ppGpp synthetase/RelA/SpoT-type nucleotidyltranferase